MESRERRAGEWGGVDVSLEPQSNVHEQDDLGVGAEEKSEGTSLRGQRNGIGEEHG